MRNPSLQTAKTLSYRGRGITDTQSDWRRGWCTNYYRRSVIA